MDSNREMSRTAPVGRWNIGPIEVIIGTKAQYIKTAPVLRELSRRGVAYRLIDTGQHAALSPDLRKVLSLDEPKAESAAR